MANPETKYSGWSDLDTMTVDMTCVFKVKLKCIFIRISTRKIFNSDRITRRVTVNRDENGYIFRFMWDDEQPILLVQGCLNSDLGNGEIFMQFFAKFRSDTERTWDDYNALVLIEPHDTT